MAVFNTFAEVDNYMATDPEPAVCGIKVLTTDGQEWSVDGFGAGGDMTETSRTTTPIYLTDEDEPFSILWHRIDDIEFEQDAGTGKLKLQYDWPAG